MRRIIGVCALAYIFLGFLLTTPTLAAVCAPGEPKTRPAAQASKKQEVVFVGVVESTANLGRTAVVNIERSIKGNVPLRKVTVRGAATDDATYVTSGDRAYEVGARYEFYPRSSKEPYIDDGCSVTSKETSPGKFTPGGEEPGSSGPIQGSADPSSDQGSLVPGSLAIGAAASAIASATVLRRRKRHAPVVYLAILLSIAGNLVVVEQQTRAANVEGAPGQQFRHWGRLNSEAQARPGVRNQIGPDAPWPAAIQDSINTWNGGTPRTDFVYTYNGPGSCDDGNLVGGITICLRADANGNLQCGNMADSAGCSFGTVAFGGGPNGINNHFAARAIRINPRHIGTDYNLARSVVCHELGHNLGLAHIEADFTNPPTCMLRSIGQSTPRQHDFDQANFNDGHGH